MDLLGTAEQQEMLRHLPGLRAVTVNGAVAAGLAVKEGCVQAGCVCSCAFVGSGAADTPQCSGDGRVHLQAEPMLLVSVHSSLGLLHCCTAALDCSERMRGDNTRVAGNALIL